MFPILVYCMKGSFSLHSKFTLRQPNRRSFPWSQLFAIPLQNHNLFNVFRNRYQKLVQFVASLLDTLNEPLVLVALECNEIIKHALFVQFPLFPEEY